MIKKFIKALFSQEMEQKLQDARDKRQSQQLELESLERKILDFIDSAKSINGRSEELYKSSSCKLTCITSKVLGETVDLLKMQNGIRKSLQWKNILTETILEIKHVQKEVNRVLKDKLV